MPDTRRSLSSLQTLLADNTAGDISAQDGRDVLVSNHPEQVIQSGALASIPASGQLTGDLYRPTDAPYLYRWNGSAWVAYGGLWPMTPPPSSGWTWLNQGSSTESTANGVYSVYGLHNGGGNGVRGKYRTAPSAPWTATFCFYFVPTFLDDASAGNGISDFGVFFRDSGGKLVTYMYSVFSNPGSKIVSYAWDSATSINTTYLNRNLPLSPGIFCWMQLFDNNTDKGLRVSPDGYNWSTVPHSHGRTTHLTPTQYGFGVNNYSMSGTISLLSLVEA